MAETSSSTDRRTIIEFDMDRGVRAGLQAASRSIDRDSHDIEAFVVTPAGEDFCEAVQSSTVIEGPVPYGVTLFPFRVLEQFCKHGTPVIPASAKEINAALDTFWPGGYTFPKRKLGQPVTETVENQTRERLQEALLSIATGDTKNAWAQAVNSLVGREIEDWQWQQYANAHTRQLARNAGYTLDKVSYTGVTNFNFNEDFGLFREAIGRHASFSFTTSTDSFYRGVPTRIPIGPYGRPLAERLLLTARFMSLYDEQDYWLRNDSVTKDNYALIRDHTTRARGYDPPIVEDSFVSGVQEADQQAMPALAALLTSSRVPGFDKHDIDALITQLYRDDLPDQLSLFARQGLAATALLYGIYIPNLVDSTPDGHLKISIEGKDRLQALMEISDSLGAKAIEAYQEEVEAYTTSLEQWRETGHVGQPPESPQEPVRTYRACPYAGLNLTGDLPQPGAINQRSEAHLKVFERMRPLGK